MDGWWQGTATALPDGRMWVSGSKIAASTDFGQTWSLRASAEVGINCPIAIDDSGHGFTGNGIIFPEVKGAVYATTNAGASWSAPVLQTPYPIRTIALEPGRGTAGLIFAAGGDYDKGAIWASADGGQSWVLQVYTNVEIHDIEAVVVPQASLVDVIAVGHNQIWRGRFALDGSLVAP